MTALNQAAGRGLEHLADRQSAIGQSVQPDHRRDRCARQPGGVQPAQSGGGGAGTRAEPVAEKHLANYCDWFEFSRREFVPPSEDNTREAKARDTLKKLLGD